LEILEVAYNAVVFFKSNSKAAFHINSSHTLCEAKKIMANKETRTQITETALECFVKHGFSKTSMTMISEHSGYSRVTVHKYFKNKSLLFRNVVQEGLQNSLEDAQQKIAQLDPNDSWQIIEAYLMAIGRTVFEQVSDDRVLRDLNDAVYDIADDIIEEKAQVTVDFIRQQLDRGIHEQRIDLQSLRINSNELAQLVDYGFSGIMRHAPVKEIKNQLHNFIRIYRKATEIKGL